MSWTIHAVHLLNDDAAIDLWIDRSGRVTGEPQPDAEVLPGRYVLPGLVDAHAHPTVGADADGPVALDPAATLEVLAAWARAGVGAIRDAGSPGGMTLDLELEPGLPHIQAAGRFLAPAGRYFPALLPEGVPPEKLVSSGLAELARGARWVKVIADFPAVIDGLPAGPAEPTYPVEAIGDLVEAVHAAGGRVAAHCTTGAAAELVRAGVDSIEHGTGLDETTLAAMAGTGAAWTPTLCAVLSTPADAPEPRRRRAAEFRERLGTLLPLAARLGVPILTGSDSAGSVGREIALLAECGLTPTEAIAAATVTARRFLGDDHSGRGGSLVTYDADPRSDLAVLSAPRAVLIDGVRVL